mmetsp:Transcript_60228/g.136172  ORF Transcript_60228/g.136172 Transcript_60228/m.136172 type:complete len:185 (-) Transcript_60228:82-636(-)
MAQMAKEGGETTFPKIKKLPPPEAEVDSNGQCLCGNVKFHCKGPLPARIGFNVLCHCRACSRARGMSPVHLVAVPASGFTVLSGSKFMRVSLGYGKLTHTFCENCGTGLYQNPEGASYVSVYPVNFQIESPKGGPACPLPAKYLPKAHVNYENRLFDWHDNLPKYLIWPSGAQVGDDGKPLPEH